MAGDGTESPLGARIGFCAPQVRRYMSAESLAKARLGVIDGEVTEEVKAELVAAS